MSDNSQQVISFDEILRGKSARITTIDGKMYISAIDIVMALTDKDNNQAAEVLRKLDNYDREELEENLRHFQFPGRGQRETPVINLDGALALVGFIKSELAKKHCKEMRKILRRYLAGDASLVGEIKANASSTNVVNQMAQESLDMQQQSCIHEESGDMSLEIFERRVRIKRMEAEIREMDAKTMLVQAESIDKLCKSYIQLCPNGIMDDRAKLMLKDCVLNVAMSQQGGLQVGGGSASQLTITSGSTSSSVATVSQEEATPLTLSTFAVQLGIRANNSQLQKAGIILARLYAQRYNGAKPSKHDQFVDGAVRSVNSYYRKDKDLVEQALREAIAK